MTDPLHVDETAAISLRGVCKHYGAVRAVDGVDLDVGYGELFGLIGHNGAGKSTLFKMMLGLIPATAGSIRVAGARSRVHPTRRSTTPAAAIRSPSGRGWRVGCWPSCALPGAAA